MVIADRPRKKTSFAIPQKVLWTYARFCFRQCRFYQKQGLTPYAESYFQAGCRYFAAAIKASKGA